jgi:exopolysaccharide biosynthesis polyprenyl glycosylphosphotransferase
VERRIPLTEAPSAAARRRALRRRAGAAPNGPVVVRRPPWETNYVISLLLLDGALVTAVGFATVLLGFGLTGQAADTVPADVVTAFIAPSWVVFLALSGAYEARVVGLGSDEFKRVFDGSVRFLATVATVAFALRLDLSRAFVAVAVPTGTAVLLAGRYLARRLLHRLRATGRACHRVIVVGSRDAATELVKTVAGAPYSGLVVVGACLPDTERPLEAGGLTVPVLGIPIEAPRYLRQVAADTLAVAGGWAIGADGLRRLSWEMEGTGAHLVVAPAITNITGPRIHIRPVAGLPLLHVEQPEFVGPRRVVKAVIDRLGALVAVVLLSPLLLLIALVVKLTSRGPVFFRQERVGLNGTRFRLWKFRSMYADAEARRASLEEFNEHDGVLFKIRRDPRVTPVGRHLRRWSLDELPQLFNVLSGVMSLVGPRPPLPEEVDRYRTDVRRRLLVKPGLTGLWQVSGRSELTWEESVQLDLHYVENWSVALDLMILWKTMFAVLKGHGAY